MNASQMTYETFIAVRELDCLV